MKKKICAVVTAVVCLFTMLPINVKAGEGTPLELESKSAILMDQKTGTIVYEKNSKEPMPPASVTKIMTLLLIYEGEEAGDFQWEDMVEVSAHAAGMGGSQVFLEEGETQSVAEMTKAITIASANDGAVAMAEFIAGSEEGFVDKMNGKAKELGMENTNFENACGLDTDGHVTSAYDIALMSREIMSRFPEITEYTTTWQDTITHKTRKGETEFGLTNTNKLIRSYDGITGLKTGSTGKALYCLSATAKRDDMEWIAVIMAAPDHKVRFNEAKKLLDHGFANYSIETGYPKGQVIGEVHIEKGEKNQVSAIAKEEISVLVPKDNNVQWETKTELLPSMKAPIEEGVKVGEMIYFLEGKEVGKTDLITDCGVEKAGIQTILEHMIKQWC